MIPAVVLWMGPEAALLFAFKMAIAGGICAALILAVRRTAPAEAIPGFMRAPFQPKAGVPYGVAIAAGALLAGAASPLLAGLYTAAGISG
jgi:prepilin peptidase CpaA